LFKFSGNGVTPEVVSAMRSAIESKWSVHGLEVTTSLGGWRASKIDVPLGRGRSYVKGNNGKWFAGEDPWVAGHEGGHLMRLDDQYIESSPGVTNPIPGWEGTMMGDYMGEVTPRDVRMILDAYDCE